MSKPHIQAEEGGGGPEAAAALFAAFGLRPPPLGACLGGGPFGVAPTLVWAGGWQIANTRVARLVGRGAAGGPPLGLGGIVVPPQREEPVGVCVRVSERERERREGGREGGREGEGGRE